MGLCLTSLALAHQRFMTRPIAVILNGLTGFDRPSELSSGGRTQLIA